MVFFITNINAQRRNKIGIETDIGVERRNRKRAVEIGIDIENSIVFRIKIGTEIAADVKDERFILCPHKRNCRKKVKSILIDIEQKRDLGPGPKLNKGPGSKPSVRSGLESREWFRGDTVVRAISSRKDSGRIRKRIYLYLRHVPDESDITVVLDSEEYHESRLAVAVVGYPWWLRLFVLNTEETP
ncbi:hypothetical protein EVAR_63590_1 [Eumeta japonica]|uniref:Uncharacterized protein n=1 Tax=Eumeta variegata TaxID=151549 RepID=A0A4C1ZN33_EUMVA|nr:hypothetical protein EVAR_63590_1 [Eumeta japonica]